MTSGVDFRRRLIVANPEHLAKLNEGVEMWNQFRTEQAIVADLSGANFSGKDLSGARLRDSDLSRVSFRGVDLRGATFDKSNLSGASLREANLQGVDLSVAKRGLRTEQLAGSDLTGATLPPELSKLYDSLENVNNISESARKLFLAVLAACLYSWLTIATTTDVNLITNRASSPLPIIQTSIPIVGFYWVAPLLLLCVYFYFHFYLQKLWEELGSLPAILPDGRPLHAKIDPWLLNDMVRAHLAKLKVNRPLLSYFQSWISLMLAWWVVPITMFIFWGRFLPRQDRTGTTFHVVLLAVSVTAALRLYRLAVVTLREVERKPFGWKATLKSYEGYRAAVFGLAVGVLFGVVSWGARWGVPSNRPVPDARALGGGLTGSCKEFAMRMPRLMALVGYSPFANLANAELSQKRPNWSAKENDPDSVIPAKLAGANLRYALASRVFLTGADLEGADLTGASADEADLSGADMKDTVLRRADLHGADLSGAYLWYAQMDGASLPAANLSGANLLGAHLSGADLRGADLGGAYLTFADVNGTDLSAAGLSYANFDGTGNLEVGTVKRAANWNKAFYDDKIISALGLPQDHNNKLAEERIKESKPQQLGCCNDSAQAGCATRN